MNMVKTLRKCPECGECFAGGRADKKFCSRRCTWRFHNKTPVARAKKRKYNRQMFLTNEKYRERHRNYTREYCRMYRFETKGPKKLPAEARAHLKSRVEGS